MTVLRPRTAGQAVRVYAREPEALPLAGGTDLMVAWNLGTLNHRTILDLSRIDAWSSVSVTKAGGLRIGALATHAQLQTTRAVVAAAPLLIAACATVGGVQIQNRGTLGGNIANASPAGDTFPPLVVYDAIVHTVSSSGRRAIPIDRVFTGPKQTTLEAAELIEAIELPAPPRSPDRVVFRKVGTRAAQAISKVVAAGQLWLTPDNGVERFRFALGSVAPTVRRLHQVEALVTGKQLTAALSEEAAALVATEIAPIDDDRSTAEYRLTVAQRILKAFLTAGG